MDEAENTSGSPMDPAVNRPAQPMPEQMEHDPERRANPRVAIEQSACIYLVKVGSKLPGQVLKLHLSGCRIRTLDRFPVGIYTRVEIEFRMQGQLVRLGGVIQDIFGRNEVGIRFLDISERKLAQLTELIAEMSPADEAEDSSLQASA